MINLLIFLLVVGGPLYITSQRWRSHQLDKKLMQTLGENYRPQKDEEAEFGTIAKKSWWRQHFDIVNEFYTPDFVLIYGLKRIVMVTVITFGYVCFVWFFCFTIDLPLMACLVGSALVILIASIVTYGSYKNAFSNYFESQFPYALRLISRNLAVGQTIYTSVDAAAINLNDIMQREFKRISSQLKSGVSFEEILDKGETIYPYKGYFVFSSYLKVSLQKGSSLRDTLLSLADDLISAQIIKKKTRALTSESRGAAVILAFLPVVMLVVMWFFNKDNFLYLFGATYGRYVVIYVVTSVSIGFFLIANMIKKVVL
ncbi:Flp pilus assembly protein TadB [Serratia fonticola]|jgi:Flp pilus assembly protein TadB|uniref:Flp pilus assembly protein TadB n=1 Tax=Serratia fonticola TaxID=47917 RepID=A0A542BHY1_SERFO|nr:type II secretion system F family protein [Serratia fonticola]TQI78173.1 Flp pilus assembly protein TadB [Serratia fonticola]TQI94829.1 Flp pilus assembly protein TadB [Serratia fonticola]TVZ69327.1 Flp pilus assembly protein TadB [Serratia fonticola]